jgi:hypothetical protein
MLKEEALDRDDIVDHKDSDPANNGMSNLECIDNAVNCQRRRKNR